MIYFLIGQIGKHALFYRHNLRINRPKSSVAGTVTKIIAVIARTEKYTSSRVFLYYSAVCRAVSVRRLRQYLFNTADFRFIQCLKFAYLYNPFTLYNLAQFLTLERLYAVRKPPVKADFAKYRTLAYALPARQNKHIIEFTSRLICSCDRSDEHFTRHFSCIFVIRRTEIIDKQCIKSFSIIPRKTVQILNNRIIRNTSVKHRQRTENLIITHFNAVHIFKIPLQSVRIGILPNTFFRCVLIPRHNAVNLRISRKIVHFDFTF